MNSTADALTQVKPVGGSNWGTGCIIINDKNQFLIIQRSDNLLWSSPGGTVDPGETPVDTILREVQEEVGLKLQTPTYLGMCYSSVDKNGVTSIWTDYSFLAFYYGKDTDVKIQQDEVKDYKWVYFGELNQYNLFLPFKHSLMMLSQYPGYKELILGAESVNKLTSIEQLVGIKNPGKNGANGHIGIDGNWSYDKKPNNTVQTIQTQSPVVNKLAVLKTSYIQYFTKKQEIQQVYKVVNGNFNFPNVNTAIKQGIVKDAQDYWKLFKEQYILYVLNTK